MGVCLGEFWLSLQAMPDLSKTQRESGTAIQRDMRLPAPKLEVRIAASQFGATSCSFPAASRAVPVVVKHWWRGYMPFMTDADLSFLARQSERLISDVAGLRDDMRVLTAVVLRLDNTRDRHEALLTDMLREMQAMNARAARNDGRLRRLEEAGQ